MVKYVFDRIRFIYPVALTIFGWIAFIGSVVLELTVTVKLMLIPAVRVLP